MKINCIVLLLICVSLNACMGYPKQVEPVTDFEVERYLGVWYEIARLDHSFERGLSQVTAEYTLREDGGLKVKNRGYSAEDDQWKDAIGKAYFVNDKDEGYLKVSFFGPFYSSYVIFELDTDYQFAFISGASHKYLWLLARTPQVSDDLVQTFIRSAEARGFDTDNLIFVDHNQ
ncbi:MAG TPA: lipocalin family protein [Cellvibrionaceae bacterium]